jgi:putative ABC transport system permease protein
VRFLPLAEHRGGGERVRQPVWFLAGAVGVILLAAALNALNLLLVRSWSRAREVAVRVALGASRRRLVAQLLTESTLLALAGGLVASFLAFVVLRLMQGILPGSITFYAPYAIVVERRTLLFTFGVAVAAGIIVGLVPALLATRGGAATAAGGALTAYAAQTPARSRLRRVLVVAEVALSVTLLVGAGLLINSFVRLNRVDPGYRLDNVAVLSLDISLASHPTGAGRLEFLRRLEERIEALPGVVGATTGGGGFPNAGLAFTSSPETDDGPVSLGGERLIIPHTVVSPDFFDLLDVRVLAGRPFSDEDQGTDNVIINTALARRFWGDANPLGRRFRPSAGWNWQTVVGVVGDLKVGGPGDRYGDLVFIQPASKSATGYAALAVRTTGDPRTYLPALRAAVRELDPRQPISELRPARDKYLESIDMQRYLLVVMAALSGIALLLAAVGVYGVLAYGVAQRHFDLGVRIALGARPAQLAGRVLGEGVALAGVGAALGCLGAVALSGLTGKLLFGVAPGDPLTIALVVAVILAAAAAASWWPARRVLRIDPVQSLRS